MQGTYNIFNEDCITGMDRLADGSVDAIIIDPPFGTTDCYWDNKLPLNEMWRQFLRVAKSNAAILIFSQMPFGAELIMSQPKLFRYEWIWRKALPVGFLNARRMPMRLHENILCFYRHLPTYNPQFWQGTPYKPKKPSPTKIYRRREMTKSESTDGRRYPVDVIDFPQPVCGGREEGVWHATKKPVGLLEYLIRTYTNKGELVLDATMGSGSTGVACVNTDREFVGFEITEEYYKIAEKRISDAMNRKSQRLFSDWEEQNAEEANAGWCNNYDGFDGLDFA